MRSMLAAALAEITDPIVHEWELYLRQVRLQFRAYRVAARIRARRGAAAALRYQTRRTFQITFATL